MLQRWSDGDREVSEPLLRAVYEQLERLARSYMRRERVGHTLETNALIHEAYFKLVDQQRVVWRNRAHFFAIAAQTMRRVLVDGARRRKAEKRGDGLELVALDDAQVAGTARSVDVLALDQVLAQLAALDERKGRVVELRFFGGLSHREIAEVLEVSLSTVESDWRLARAWLYQAMSDGA
ncbi:MAG: sigma-70 family RNA polymerase sigma factor [Haliangiales bacterium]